MENVFDTDLARILGGATDGSGITVKRRERKTVKTREGDSKVELAEETGGWTWYMVCPLASEGALRSYEGGL